MLIPKLFFTLLNKFIKNQSFKDTILYLYFMYIKKFTSIKIYVCSEILELSKIYPEKVKLKGNSAYFYNVYLLNNGILMLNKTVFIFEITTGIMYFYMMSETTERFIRTLKN